ncbi:hypothetical protein EBU94_03580 [bacterium]|nr:hypothetical protein [bacterium]
MIYSEKLSYPVNFSIIKYTRSRGKLTVEGIPTFLRYGIEHYPCTLVYLECFENELDGVPVKAEETSEIYIAVKQLLHERKNLPHCGWIVLFGYVDNRTEAEVFSSVDNLLGNEKEMEAIPFPNIIPQPDPKKVERYGVIQTEYYTLLLKKRQGNFTEQEKLDEIKVEMDELDSHISQDPGLTFAIKLGKK